MERNYLLSPFILLGIDTQSIEFETINFSCRFFLLPNSITWNRWDTCRTKKTWDKYNHDDCLNEWIHSQFIWRRRRWWRQRLGSSLLLSLSEFHEHKMVTTNDTLKKSSAHNQLINNLNLFSFLCRSCCRISVSGSHYIISDNNKVVVRKGWMHSPKKKNRLHCRRKTLRLFDAETVIFL